MRCPDHCPSDGGLPWPWILLALVIAAFAVAATWFAVLVGRLGLVLIGAIPAIVVLGMITLFVLNAIENARRAKEAKVPRMVAPTFEDGAPAVSPAPARAKALPSAVDVPAPSPQLRLLPGGLADDGTGGERVA